MLVPEGDYSRSALVTAEQLSMGSLEVDAKEALPPITANDAFAELDQLLTARIALRKNYQLPDGGAAPTTPPARPRAHT